MNEREALADLLAAHAVEPAAAERLSAYGALLLKANRTLNLTGARTPESLLPHVLDALTIRDYVREPLVDVGSGGGLPAIPLALALGMRFTLIESVGKKAAFLRKAIAELDIPGDVISERAEDAGRDPALREAFASATARAVATAPTVLELLLPLVAVGGWAILQRGSLPDAERNAVSDAAPMLGGVLREEVRLEGERRILLVEKVGPTPERFPRRAGVPAKRPLCL